MARATFWLLSLCLGMPQVPLVEGLEFPTVPKRTVLSTRALGPPPALMSALSDIDDFSLGQRQSESARPTNRRLEQVSLLEDSGRSAEVAEQLGQYKLTLATLQRSEYSDSSSIRHIREWLHWYQQVESKNVELEDENAALTKNNEQTLEDVRRGAAILDAQRAEEFQREKEAKQVQAAVNSQREYSEACKKEEQRLYSVLTTLQGKRFDERHEASDIAKNRHFLEGHLASETETLRARLDKARKNRATVLAQLEATRSNHEALEAEAPGRLAVLRNSLGRLRGQANVMEQKIVMREQERLQHEALRRALGLKIEVAKTDNFGMELASMQTNHTQLINAVNTSHAALATMQQSIAEQNAAALQSQQLEASSKAAAESAAKRAQLLARQYLIKVTDAWKPVRELETRAQAKVLEVESQSLMPCEKIWDMNNMVLIQELNTTCQAVKKDIAATQAIIASLTSLTS